MAAFWKVEIILVGYVLYGDQNIKRKLSKNRTHLRSIFKFFEKLSFPCMSFGNRYKLPSIKINFNLNREVSENRLESILCNHHILRLNLWKGINLFKEYSETKSLLMIWRWNGHNPDHLRNWTKTKALSQIVLWGSSQCYIAAGTNKSMSL